MSRRNALRLALGALAFAVVALGLTWLVRPNWEQRAIVAVAGASDSAVLDVTVEHGVCAGSSGARVTVDESAEDVVRLSAEYDAGGDCDDIAVRTAIGVELERLLGDRAIEASGPARDLACDIAGTVADRCTAVDADR